VALPWAPLELPSLVIPRALPLPLPPNKCGTILTQMFVYQQPPTNQVVASRPLSLQGKTTGDPMIDSFIIESAARNGVDPVLLYSVMHQESAFNQRAVSPKGARGLMQLTPATAGRFGVRNIFNPRQNIEAGARYLRFLLDKFNGDVSLALAGYNAGEGTVKKYGGRVPPYRETIKYVSQIKQHYASICEVPME